jgi:hypothetical protein
LKFSGNDDVLDVTCKDANAELSDRGDPWAEGWGKSRQTGARLVCTALKQKLEHLDTHNVLRMFDEQNCWDILYFVNSFFRVLKRFFLSFLLMSTARIKYQKKKKDVFYTS